MSPSIPYVELITASNFTFLSAASHLLEDKDAHVLHLEEDHRA